MNFPNLKVFLINTKNNFHFQFYALVLYHLIEHLVKIHQNPLLNQKQSIRLIFKHNFLGFLTRPETDTNSFG